MRLTPDDDAEQLRTVVAAFLDRHCPVEAQLRRIDSGGGWDDDIWQRLAVEVGLAALELPESVGGAGATFREVAVAAEELGRVPVRLPWLSTAVLALTALHGAGRSELDDITRSLAHGERTAALAYLDPQTSPDGNGTTAIADVARRTWTLHGQKDWVIEGTTADVLLVVAGTDSGPALFLVDATSDGLVRTEMRAMDPTRQLARVTFDRVEARAVLTDPSETRALMDRVLLRARVALACEQLGGAEAAMWMAVRYANQRMQFGQPIATFQAIKHRCADMAVRVEAARSAVLWAVAAVADNHSDAPLAAATASMVCSEAYRWVAAEMIQVHGGIGFTWEHPAHLHFRRAVSSAVLVDAPSRSRDRILDLLGV
jgi:alkylation response protein AidB-like acyl-CoA dehydrogenase